MEKWHLTIYWKMLLPVIKQKIPHHNDATH